MATAMSGKQRPNRLVRRHDWVSRSLQHRFRAEVWKFLGILSPTSRAASGSLSGGEILQCNWTPWHCRPPVARLLYVFFRGHALGSGRRATSAADSWFARGRLPFSTRGTGPDHTTVGRRTDGHREAPVPLSFFLESAATSLRVLSLDCRHASCRTSSPRPTATTASP